MQAGTEMVVTAYRIPRALFTSFRYLGIVLSVSDDTCPGVIHNLRRVWQKWAWLYRVLISQGTDAQTSGRIYVTAVHSVMLYGLDMWVITLCIGRVWEGFCHRVDRRLTGRQPRRGRYS